MLFSLKQYFILSQVKKKNEGPELLYAIAAFEYKLTSET